MKRNDYKNVFILLFFSLIFIIALVATGNLFGSDMDWINQHTVIPEYFRNYFYKTGKLLPDVIYNLGLGENAFNFSYYGLLNPIVLISYLCPFISMTSYIMVSSIILYLLSVYLLYRFLRPKYEEKLTLLLTFIFMCASPILFQFHRQIMFVNYLPFLIMALINIDNYERTSSRIFLVVNITMMILTSYYFSVSGILVILIYYVYSYFNKSIKEKLNILFPIIISILVSGIIIIPSLYAILNSRSITTESTNLLTLFIPNFNYSDVLYGSYALGLLSISIISLLHLLLKKERPYKFLGLILLIIISFPIFRYLLNGGLYIRSKILIPFIPIMVVSLGIFLKDLFTRQVELKKLIFGVLILVLLSLFNFNLVYFIDLIITTILIILYCKFGSKLLVVVPIVVTSCVIIVVSNLNENYISYSEYNDLYANDKTINHLISSDDDFYRIAELNNSLYNVNRNFSNNHYKSSIYSSNVNPHYKNFYYNLLNVNNNNYNNLIIRDTDNIIFNRLMSTKYVLSNHKLGYGYSHIEQDIYKNDYALPLGYASNNIYSKDRFDSLSYPYNLKYLLNGIVVEEDIQNDTQDIIEKYNFDLIGELQKLSFIEESDGSYYINLHQNETFEILLDESLEQRLLFITINGLESNSCSVEDISISINGQENSLSCDSWLYHNQNYTFDYVVNEKDLKKLTIIMKKGQYKIDSIDLYTMDIKHLTQSFDEMYDIKISDNEIVGTIDVSDDGYMNISIPYDSSFKVFVDGEKVEIKRTNLAFIGFKISRGTHTIRIIYNAPGLKFGVVCSTFGLLLFVIYLFKLLKRNNNFVKIK